MTISEALFIRFLFYFYCYGLLKNTRLFNGFAQWTRWEKLMALGNRAWELRLHCTIYCLTSHLFRFLISYAFLAHFHVPRRTKAFICDVHFWLFRILWKIIVLLKEGRWYGTQSTLRAIAMSTFISCRI